MIYDGDCPFCQACRRWAQARTPKGRVHWQARQSAPAGADWAAACELSCACNSLVFLDGDRTLVKSRAIVRLVKEFRRPWCWLAGLDWLPRSLADALYDQVAARRLRLNRPPGTRKTPGV